MFVHDSLRKSYSGRMLSFVGRQKFWNCSEQACSEAKEEKNILLDTQFILLKSCAFLVCKALESRYEKIPWLSIIRKQNKYLAL